MDVKKVASLAKLNLTSSEIKKFTPQLEQIMHFIGQLSGVNTDKILPTDHINNLHNIYREDNNPQESFPVEIATSGSQKAKDHYFVVDAVIDNS